jgi:hypothetical protein
MKLKNISSDSNFNLKKKNSGTAVLMVSGLMKNLK